MTRELERRRRGRPKGFHESSVGPIRSIERAFDVLEVLASSDGVTLSELSERLGQSVTTMHRVLSTLERRRYAEHVIDCQEWHVGSQAFRLGSSFLRRNDVVEQSRPDMRELMLATGETSNLGIERQGDVLFVSQIETHESIRAFFPPGTLSPLHASGIGKALLSAFDAQRLARFLHTTELTCFTETTITSRDKLVDEVRQIQGRGYALDNEERSLGMRCVAACVTDMYDEVVAGISVSGPVSRLPLAAIPEIGMLVKQAAQRISEKMGASQFDK
ncbi:HTH-type transcriptional regulator BhcR [Methylopila sp. M107]|uniref:HTH-type transcriptional regulator BhcR n=1 Tax=Methylopila sp. M107 TaxID=1101190 RepID=UPI00058EE748|nr:HTH-type transcriptional regulator BhcR [Methylopila sp. M107]